MRHAAADVVAPVPVSVHAGHRRLDVALPATIPVVELMPDLLTTLGVLDEAADGCALLLASGRGLESGDSLAAQGVGAGAVLSLVAGSPPPPRLYDDPVAAVLDVPAREVPEPVRRATILGVAGLCLAALWAALVMSPGSVTTVLSGCLALLLVAAGAALAGAWPGAALALAGGSSAFAGVAGWWLGESAQTGSALLGAGGAMTMAAALGALALESGRGWLLTPAAAGCVLAVPGGTQLAGLDPTLGASAALVLAALLPAAAGRLTATVLDPGERALDDAAAATLVARARTTLDQLNVSGSTATLAASLLLAPAGMAAVPVLAVAGAVTLLRAGGSVVRPVAGATSGTLIMLMAASAVEDPVALALPAAGALTALCAGLRPPAVSGTWRRARDRAEVVALVALPPAALLASGAIQWIRAAT